MYVLFSVTSRHEGNLLCNAVNLYGRVGLHERGIDPRRYRSHAGTVAAFGWATVRHAAYGAADGASAVPACAAPGLIEALEYKLAHHGDSDPDAVPVLRVLLARVRGAIASAPR